MAEISDDRVLLLEQTLQKNKEMIEENQKLRDELKARGEEHNKVLSEVLNKLNSIEENQKTGNHGHAAQPQQKRKKKQIQVPSTCRRTLRKVFAVLSEKNDFAGFHLNESVNSPRNVEILKRVRDEVFHYVGGKEHCLWSNAQIDESFRRYFLTTLETKQKKDGGVYELHKQKCRRQGRKREKMTRRTLALESVKKWDAGRKGKIAEVLAEPYMSSEESGEEEGSKVYVVKTIPWESRLLKKRKRKLDKAYCKTVSKRSKQRSVRRVRRDGVHSSVPKPEDCPDWACVE